MNNNTRKTIGIIGGGQLGQMLAIEAIKLGFDVHIYSNENNSPATYSCMQYTIGYYSDSIKILGFASKCDIVTSEFESIPSNVLKNIETTYPDKLHPSSNAFYISQNRLREKNFIQNLGIPVPPFSEITTHADIKTFYGKNGNSIIKTAEQGYDGKGQFRILNESDIKNFTFQTETQYIIEAFVAFESELSCILTRNIAGEIAFYPIPLNIHKSGILHKSIIKNDTFAQETYKLAQEYTTKIATSLNFVGTMCAEYFVSSDKTMTCNEIAPRVHNSGHFTLDLCTVNQFENHVRAISNLPILQTHQISSGEMINLIGDDIVNILPNFLDKPNAKIHMYGKRECKIGRKMGHITLYNI